MEKGEDFESFAAQVEYTQAFYGMANLICGYLVGAGIAEREDMASRIIALADRGGADLARITGRPAEPNRFLVEVASGVRNIGASLSIVPDRK